MGPADTSKKLEAKIKKLIQTELNNKNLAEDFKLGGGFLQFLQEGAKIYDTNAEAIKSTGLLLDKMAGPQGLAKKFADFAETGVEIFGGIENTSKAIKDLTQNMRSFSMFQETAQASFVKTLAVFKELGVGVTDFTGILDSARIGFGMATEDADKLARSVGAIGMATGVGMGEAMKNFRTAQSTMAYSSGKILDNFRKLQFTAATTGVEFGKLTSAFGESMDTFEGSASKAGTLNAILGRSVFNSIDLLGQTEAQRVETIVQGIRKSTDVQALSKNKFQLKAVASGLGLTVDETRKLLSGQMTVDQALAQKESTDPRQKAMGKMADLLNKHVNPGFEFFAKQLDKMRSLGARAGIKANVEQRKFIRDLLSGTGIETPTALLLDVENALENLLAVNDKIGYKKLSSAMGETFGAMKRLALNDYKGTAAQIADQKAQDEGDLKGKFNDLSNYLNELRKTGYMTPLEPDASTKELQRARQSSGVQQVFKQLQQFQNDFQDRSLSQQLGSNSTFILQLDSESGTKFKGHILQVVNNTNTDQNGKVVGQ